MQRKYSLAFLFFTLMVSGCKDLTGGPGLPAGTPDPSFYNNGIGALGMRNAAIYQVEQALPQYVGDAGLLTDELEDANTGASAGTQLLNAGTVTDPLDERILPVGSTGGEQSYSQLQAIRTLANQAIGALATYDTASTSLDSAKILRGELYALEGYAEIMLADLFCSGVPLSTLNYQKDYTYAPSSTTTQVYQDAIAKFDTALIVASASDSVVRLAQVGKGRAYLDLGPQYYAAAADDVVTVPSNFQYQIAILWFPTGFSNTVENKWTVSDGEGRNGLPFLSSHDPRTTVEIIRTTNASGNSLPVPQTFPLKYNAALSGLGFAPFTIASGIEARLIQAEAQLQPANAPTGPWLTTLNMLRANAATNTYGLIPTLPDTSDPGIGLSGSAAATARIALLFRERAYWLFLDGHRQGDLRRLLRQYSQWPAFKSSSLVYPTGPYLAPGTGFYGQDVAAPIPETEDENPYFHGCITDTNVP